MKIFIFINLKSYIIIIILYFYKKFKKKFLKVKSSHSKEIEQQ